MDYEFNPPKVDYKTFFEQFYVMDVVKERNIGWDCMIDTRDIASVLRHRKLCVHLFSDGFRTFYLYNAIIWLKKGE